MSGRHTIDRVSFATCVAVILLVCLPLARYPETGGQVLLDLYDWIAHELGYLYLLGGMATLLFLAWLALGRFGTVVLAAAGEGPEFSRTSWAAMLFCAGIGAGLLAWAPIEWAYYLDAPPFGFEPRSVAAVEWAATYGIFHWGFTAWAFYCLPTVALAYAYYVKRTRGLKFSNSCLYLLGGRENTRAGRLIDLCFMIGLIGGAGSSLGFSTPMISALLGRLTGLTAGFGMEFGVITASVALFSVSVWLGLRRGIKRLSEFNLWLALALLAFVLLAGPTLFLLKTSLNSVGLMLDNFIRMNSWTDAFTGSEFVENWTIFYWAWWIAYGPFVGLFVTRISRGRTIREVVFGMLGYGTLGCALFYMIIGNFGLHLELSGAVAVSETLQEQGAAQATASILDALPLGGVVMALYALVGLVFSVTTYDSASYILASSATANLPAGDDPERWHRVFWALALAVLPLTLLFIGGLKVVQTATLVVSLPLLLIAVLMAYSLARQLAADHDPPA
ncbi:MAG: BCCT family transporter [Xanthomonadales bacterium]|nr:BCCT family transporter [Xanthomonadales bacterium]NIN59092.1 BCCT family transporter [Xanthomonadales bacterium]NIN74403.1 BCCT family transporter [Xanthomonadales bacterium]NIO13206.1 BCCT family transporter [Xanthomonadales bacterium]NIP11485.1 BCCT family transporter [Xanthomonadales bacterium]